MGFKYPKILQFTPKIDFNRYIVFKIGYILIDLNWIFSIEPSDFKNFHFNRKL